MLASNKSNFVLRLIGFNKNIKYSRDSYNKNMSYPRQY